MTMQRVQWTCPICNRRYAIPATAATPSRCPQCTQAEQQSTAKRPAPFSVALVDDEPEEDVRETQPISALAAIELEVAEEAARGPTAAAPITRRTNPALKTLDGLALAYTVIAGLTAVGAFVGLLYGLRAAFVMDPTPARTNAIFLAIATFVGGLIAALTFYTLREIIRVLLTLEENTRQR